MERTVLVIKPRAVSEGLTGRIIADVERAGFRLIGVSSRVLSREEAERFYEMHRGQYFFDGLVDFMASGLSVAVLLEAPDALPRLRELVGATEPSKAAPATLRATYGKTMRSNAVHASDSPERASSESEIYFGDARAGAAGGE